MESYLLIPYKKLVDIKLSAFLLIVQDIEMDKWEFYKDGAGLWRWRRTAPNGRIVGSSSQGYVNKSDCEDNARRNGWTG